LKIAIFVHCILIADLIGRTPSNINVIYTSLKNTMSVGYNAVADNHTANAENSRDLQSFEIRFQFKSAVPIQFENDRPIWKSLRPIHACPVLVVVKSIPSAIWPQYICATTYPTNLSSLNQPCCHHN